MSKAWDLGGEDMSYTCSNCKERSGSTGHYSFNDGRFRCATSGEKPKMSPLGETVLSKKADPTVLPSTQPVPDLSKFGIIESRLPPYEAVAGVGYHLRKISKGVLGDVSKIREELEELEDACEQGARVMQLVELADMVGAIQAFLDGRFPGMSVDDLCTMAHITRRAFENGHRK